MTDHKSHAKRRSRAASKTQPSEPVEAEEETRPDVHLVLLLHGLYGSPSNLWCLEEEIRAPCQSRKPEGGDEDGASAVPATPSSDDGHLETVVLNARSYIGAQTWDGIDVNAQRVAKELDDEIARLADEGQHVSVISIMGYSLGGLIARALVGQLHARSPSFFTKHRPAAFTTIATPHLGVLKYGSWQSQWIHALGKRLFSRTGQQLYCLDTDRGTPFLAVMAHPDRIYLRALALFPAVTIFANGINDLTVPYCTAAICAHDPFIDHGVTGKSYADVQLDGHIVTSWLLRDPDDEEVEALIAVTGSADSEENDDSTAKEQLPASTDLPPVSAVGIHAHRPWLPPVFYLNRKGIMRYALFPLIPFLIPVVLGFIAVTFAYHTFQSSQRLRVFQSGDSRPLLLGYDGEGYDSVTDTADTSRAGTPPMVPSGADLSQPLLTPLQQSMVTNLSALPLERVVAWFPTAFNAHAVIIARNARVPRFAWQDQGKQVVRAWADRVLATAREAVAKSE